MAKAKRAAKKTTAGTIWKRIGLTALVLFIITGLTGLGAFAYLYATTDLPDPNADFQTNTTFLYYNDGDHPAGLPRGPEPGHAGLRGDAAADEGRRRRGREPQLLGGSGLLGSGHRAQHGVHRHRRRAAGRLHHHPAVHQDPLPGLRAAPVAQGQGAVPGHQDGPGAVQGGDPRGLPQHHLLRPRRLRHPGGSQVLLPQGRQRPHASQETAALAAILNNPAGFNPSGGPEKRRAAARPLPVRARRHARDGRHHRGGARRGPPAAARVPGGTGQRPLRRPEGLPDQGGRGRASRPAASPRPRSRAAG